MAQKAQQMGLKRLITYLFIVAIIAAVAVFALPERPTAHAEGFEFVGEYTKSIMRNYDGTTDEITVTTTAPDATYVWFKGGIRQFEGQTLAVKDVADSGDYECRVTSELFNDTITTSKISVAIISPKVTVDIVPVESVYGEPIKELQYTVYNPEAIAAGETAEDLKINLTKEAGISAGKYSIKGSYDNPNYRVEFRSAIYTVRPKKLTGRLTGVNNLVYNGKTPQIGFEIIGDGADLELTPVISFDKAVCNAGEYVAYVNLGNRNYVADDEYPFTVKKAPLKIILTDMAFAEGKDAEFKYVGFVNGETEGTLLSKPEITVPTAAGIYSDVMPSGAESNNYEIEYIGGKIVVYKTELECKEATLSGEFMPDSVLEVEEVGTAGFGRLDRLPVAAYKVDAQGGVIGEYRGKMQCGSYFPLFLRACIIDSNGVKHRLNGFSVADGTLSFKADTDGTLYIYYDLTVPIIIISIALFLALIIIIKVSGDKKRYKKALHITYAAKVNAAMAVRTAEKINKE